MGLVWLSATAVGHDELSIAGVDAFDAAGEAGKAQALFGVGYALVDDSQAFCFRDRDG